MHNFLRLYINEPLFLHCNTKLKWFKTTKHKKKKKYLTVYEFIMNSLAFTFISANNEFLKVLTIQLFLSWIL